MIKTSECYLCGSDQIYDFFKMPPLPTQDGIMCSTEEEAIQVVRGSIELRFCRRCGYVGNEGHEPEKVRFDDYDFSNDQSPMYAKSTQELSDRLITRYDLRGKSIVDIGCGDGDFLKTVCKRGGNKGVGIDPGFDHSKRASANGVDLTFYREYYSEKHSQFTSDLVTSRHVMTLPSDPVAFIRLIRKNLEHQPHAIVYFDVPNVRYTIGEKVIWNVVYEHRSWYSQESLTYLMELAGFEVLDIDLCWNGEYLYVEARPNPTMDPPQLPDPQSLVTLEEAINSFVTDFSELMENNTRKIEEINAQNKKTLAWGAGARAVTFFNLFDLKKEVPCIVDINTNRQGKFLPGSGQEIVAPEFIQAYQPEMVIITNPTYAAEIKEQVHSLGIHPEFWEL